MILRTAIFLLINFGALALGSYLMNGGSTGEWYLELKKAPWTPPGWAFGAAWTTIMIAFSIYMSVLWGKVSDTNQLRNLFIIQFVLNVGWNPIFFDLHEMTFGLIVLLMLIYTLLLIFLKHRSLMKSANWFIAPYILWLFVAASLNAYALLSN